MESSSLLSVVVFLPLAAAILLLFVPLVNLWPVVELLFLRGTVGPNQYGPDPV